ncbi:MAG: glycosyltransferase family 2 protein [Nonlabens sp.]
MKAGILILNWNGLEHLKRYLPSVVANSPGHKIYLVDNNSMDESIKWVTVNYTEVDILVLKENSGYAGGYNQAMNSVKEEIICLLNNDVEVTPGWCDAIVQTFQTDQSVAACQPKILDWNQKDQFEHAGAAGGFLDQLGYPYCRGRIFNTLEQDHGQYDTTVDIDWATGACLFVRKSVFLEAGGFDPDYFAHQEEIDLCWRLRSMGHRIICNPASQVYHLGGGTLSMNHPKKVYLNFRNSLFNIVKNEQSTFWVGKLFLRMVLDGIAVLYFVLKKQPQHLFAILKAHRSLYSSMKSLLAKRKVNKRLQQRVIVHSLPSILWSYFIMQKQRYSDL